MTEWYCGLLGARVYQNIQHTKFVLDQRSSILNGPEISHLYHTAV